MILLLRCSFIFMGFIGLKASNIKKARKHAKEKLLPLERIAGITHRENPPKIIVYLEHEKYKDKVQLKEAGSKQRST